MVSGVNNLQFPDKTTILSILREATFAVRAQLKDVLSKISDAALHSNGNTKYRKQ